MASRTINERIFTVKKEVIAEGKDIQEARANAFAALGASDTDTVEYAVMEMPSRGFLGIGAKPAKVKAWMNLPDAEPVRQRRRSAKPKQEQKDTFVPPAEPTPVREPMKPEVEVKLTPREVSEGEDLSLDFVRRLIANLGIRAEANLFTRDEDGRQICIDGEDAGMLIGRHGETLDALQYLSNLACAKKNIHGERIRDHVTIDIEGYRAKREATLRALARRMAAKAQKNGRNVTLEPMNAYERRIIHSEVQGIPGVATNSIGSDSNRRVVIYLTDKAPAEEQENND